MLIVWVLQHLLRHSLLRVALEIEEVLHEHVYGKILCFVSMHGHACLVVLLEISFFLSCMLIVRLYEGINDVFIIIFH